MDRTAAVYNGQKNNTIKKNIDNALYCESLCRMFDAVNSLVIALQEHDKEDKGDWIPDIFEISSNILMDIMKDYNMPDLTILL